MELDDLWESIAKEFGYMHDKYYTAKEKLFISNNKIDLATIK